MWASAQGSLLFDLEVALPAEDIQPGFLMEDVIDTHTLEQRLQMLFRASCPFARELRNIVQSILAESGRRDAPSVDILARRLASRGYVVVLRTALSGVGADCFKSLRHEFLVVRGTGDYSGMEFIVEPSLRQHFTIPHPSPEYAFILGRTPDVFVGGSCRLVSIVQLLCALMAESFERQGLALPPWRKEQAMLSKWIPQPTRSRDIPLPTVSPCPTTTQPPSGGGRKPPALPTGYGFSDWDDAVHPMAADADADVCRTDSDSSNVSLALGCSPTSVLPPVDQAAGHPGLEGRQAAFCAVHGFDPPMPRDAAAAAAVAAAAVAASDGSQDGILPLLAGKGKAPANPTDYLRADEAGGAIERADAAASYELQPGLLWGSGGDGGASDGGGVDAAVEDCSGGDSGDRAGLLSVQLQQRPSSGNGAAEDRQQQRQQQQQQQARPDAGLPHIRTRPPAYRGGMAIRVVKLVGFSAAPAPAAAAAAPIRRPLDFTTARKQPQQPQQQPWDPQRPAAAARMTTPAPGAEGPPLSPPRASYLPWRPNHRTA